MEKKIVICEINTKYPQDQSSSDYRESLTIGKEYEVTQSWADDQYSFTGDDGRTHSANKERFKLKEQTMDLKQEIDNLKTKLSDLEKQVKEQEACKNFKENDWIFWTSPYISKNSPDVLAKVARIDKGGIIRCKEWYTETGKDLGDGEYGETSCNWRLATTSEIEKILIKVAKNKGFVEGVSFQMKDRSSDSKSYCPTYKLKLPFNLDIKGSDTVLMDNDSVYIYNSDKSMFPNTWAEIVKQDELPYLLGHTGKMEGNDVVYGCKRITKQKLSVMIDALQQLEADNIQFAQGKITMADLEKIEKFLKIK